MPIPANVKRVDRAMVRGFLTARGRGTTAPGMMLAQGEQGTTVRDISDAQIDAALAQVDQDAIFDEERGQLTVEVWDRKSPINGVPAGEVLAKRTDLPSDGEVYLIQRDGRVWVFQPHEPNVQGFVKMTRAKANAIGNRHSDEIAGGRMQSRVLEAVTKHLPL